ncbi:uncharacterized protein LOC134251085 [Saccostrea cucullata]|uniref:uncharacterized protein LOC134251085 n=1 Tax=Saccostrea cuccullata TaxID=36930 RepID=UPI002ED28FF2
MARRIMVYVVNVMFYVCFISLISSDDLNICKNEFTGQHECCTDYKNISGICQACIGFYGKSCNLPCPLEFYGHGCKEKCHCSEQQICDKTKGCLAVTNTSTGFSQNSNRIDNLKTTIIAAVTLVIFIFGALWTACFLQMRLRRQRRKNINISKSAPSGDTPKDNQEQGEYIYNDVRESQMFEKEAINPVVCNSLQRQHLNNFAHLKSSKSLPRHYKTKGRQQMPCASSDSFDYYGSPETYNHLQYKKMCTLPAKPSVPHKNCSMKVNPPNLQYSSMSVMTEMYNKGQRSQHQTPEDSSTLPRPGNPQTRHFRPYSSVRYNRNAKPEIKTIH